MKTLRYLFWTLLCSGAFLFTACTEPVQPFLGDYSYKVTGDVVINDSIITPLTDKIGSLNVIHIDDSTVLLTLNELEGGVYTTRGYVSDSHIVIDPFKCNITIQSEEIEDFSLRPTTILTTYATEVSGQATRYEHTLLFDLRYQGTSISDSSTLVGDHITMVAKKN
ncbi:MAG: hypothetical protein J6V62_04805 [Paludibacteraceae bacterium]|nr:hypothetical protein [Paludibacteraceae bacterium]